MRGGVKQQQSTKSSREQPPQSNNSAPGVQKPTSEKAQRFPSAAEDGRAGAGFASAPGPRAGVPEPEPHTPRLLCSGSFCAGCARR